MSQTITVTVTSRPILGPLLTTYTPPSECSSYGGPTYEIGEAYQGQGCDNGRVHDTATCWPSANVPAPEGAFNGWGFFSPGTLCPSGYTSACANRLSYDGPAVTSDPIPGFNFQYPLIAGESAVGCCPSGFTCRGNDLQTCVSIITSGNYEVGYCPTGDISIDTLTDFQPVEVPGTNFVTVDYPLSTLSSSVTTATLYAPLFQINWQATDLPYTSTIVSSPTATTTTAPLLTPTITSSTSGLSIGAKVAIGLTLPIAVLALAALLGFWLLHRRRPNRIKTAQPASIANTHELKRTELDAASRPRELEESRPELLGDRPSSPEPQELGS